LEQLPVINAATDLLLIVDHYVQAELLSGLAVRSGQSFQVLLDVDIGMNRTGIRPGLDAARLAEAVDLLPGIQIVGIMGYEGHLLLIDDPEEKRSRIMDAMGVLQHTQSLMQKKGIACDIVSAGGTGSYQITKDHGAVSELQAGGGIFGDPFYVALCGTEGIEQALYVTADVVSRPSLDRAVINCGLKMLDTRICKPRVVGVAGAEPLRFSAEHCVLDLSGNARDLQIGDSIRMTVGYSDLTLLLHRELTVLKNGAAYEKWPIIRPTLPDSAVCTAGRLVSGEAQ
jgi:D-serine deaminase-like pyridoxal phosphate-dependent protein